jgi:dTMP kinase
MDLRVIPRTAVDRYVKLVRWPVDTTLERFGVNGGVAVAVDRAEATVRAAAGAALGDDELREDARRRFEAADERTKALRLETEAELRSQRAAEEADEKRSEAQRTRRTASQRAQQQRKQADQRRQERVQSAESSARRRKQANAKVTQATKEAVQDRAKRTKLDELETRSDALGTREEALTAQDEAQRLADAAAKAKAARKSS